MSSTLDPQEIRHRLCAVLAADAVGYSQWMSVDDRQTVQWLQAARHVFAVAVQREGGRVVDTAGDSILAVFDSAGAAVAAALAAQSRLLEADSGVGQLQFRMGLHLGDVLVSHDRTIYGDGVNTAARVQAAASPGGILASSALRNAVGAGIEAGFEDAGTREFKNIARPVQLFVVTPKGDSGGKTQLGLQAVSSPLTVVTQDRPSLAVLPFSNVPPDPEQEYFADGIVDELITALSCIKSFFVISRTSTFTYKGKPVDIREVGRALGVRYVLEGTVRRSGPLVRIHAQLIEATTGRQIWANKFEGATSDVFALQDEISARVAAALEPTLRKEEMSRASLKRTEDLAAYDLYLRSLNPMYTMTRSSLESAISLTSKALKLDPEFAQAKAVAAFSHGILCSLGLNDEHQSHAIRLAREAMESAPDDPSVLRMVGHVLGYCAKDYDTALAAIDRSLSLNPNCSQAYSASGWVRLYVADSRAAEKHFREAMRLSPLDPERGIALNGLSFAMQMQGALDEALALSRQAVRETNFPSARKQLIHTLVCSDRLEEARAEAGMLLKISPGFTIAKQLKLTPFTDPEFARQFVEALERAGIPAT